MDTWILEFLQKILFILLGCIPIYLVHFLSEMGDQIDDESPQPQSRTPHIPKKLKNKLWKKYATSFGISKCYACRDTVRYTEMVNLGITVQGWEPTYVVALEKGGKIELDNLRVCCRDCNRRKGNENLYQFILANYFTGPGRDVVLNYIANNREMLT